MYVLTMAERVNHVGDLQVQKLMRAYRERPNLMRKLMSTSFPAITRDPRDGNYRETVGFRIDAERIDRIFGQVAKALYFFAFGTKWTEQPDIIIQFARFQGQSVSDRRWQAISSKFDELFARLPSFGAQPDAFHFQKFETSDVRMLRMVFYGGCAVIARFEHNTEHLAGAPYP